MKKLASLVVALCLCCALFVGAAMAETEVKSILITEQWSVGSIDPVSNGKVVNQKLKITETLVNTDNSLNLLPGLATEWHNTDENTWVFQIREGVTFHDGTPMTAEEVRWSIQNALEQRPTQVSLTKIDTVEATDTYELTITTSEPNAELPAYLHDSSMAIVGAGSYNEAGEFVTPVGTGPFTLDYFDEALGEISVVKYDGYWGDMPGYDCLTMQVMTDPSIRAMAIENQEVDIAVDVPFSEIESLAALDYLTVECHDTNRVYYAYLNANSFFADKSVRQALSYAIDRETIYNDVLYGCGTPAVGPFNADIAWSNTEMPGYPYDPVKAQELLTEAGWTDSDGDGVLDKDGVDFKFDLLTFSDRPGLPKMAEAMQAMLGEVGMAVEIKIMDSGAIKDEIANSDTWGINLTTAQSCLVPSCSYFFQNAFSSATTSAYGYENAELDAMITACMSEFDQEKRYELSKELQAYLVDEAEEIFICNYGVSYVFNETISNFKFDVDCRDWILNADIHVNK